MTPVITLAEGESEIQKPLIAVIIGFWNRTLSEVKHELVCDCYSIQVAFSHNLSHLCQCRENSSEKNLSLVLPKQTQLIPILNSTSWIECRWASLLCASETACSEAGESSEPMIMREGGNSRHETTTLHRWAFSTIHLIGGNWIKIQSYYKTKKRWPWQQLYLRGWIYS